VVVVACNLTVPIFVNWKYHEGEATRTGAFISAAASLLILNAIAIKVIRARDKRNGQATPRGFVAGAAGLALLSAAITTVGLYSVSQRNDILELTLSGIPLDQIHPERKALVVGLARRRLALGRDYEQIAAQAKPISPPLYSADSFSNESAIRSVSEQYKQANVLDVSNEEQQELSTNEFREKMKKVDPDYLKSLEVGFKEQQTQRAQVLQLQHECLTTTVALYDYADAHTKDIVVTNGQLHFMNASVQMEFSRQLEGSKSLYQRWQEAFRELAQGHQKVRTELGLGPKS
jgi:hypothetical protein